MNKLDEERLAKETRLAEQKQNAILQKSDFKAVIDTPEGRRFIRRVLAECGVHQSSYSPESTHANMAYKEGRRRIGLWIQSLFADFPDQYIQLLKEETHVIQTKET